MPRKKQNNTEKRLNLLEKRMEGLERMIAKGNEIMGDLLERMKEKEQVKLQVEEQAQTGTEQPQTDYLPTGTEQPQTGTQQYIPTEYREIVNEVLNKKFGIQIDYLPDKPEFIFSIIVPKEYSNMSEQEWEVKKADIRSKVISIAEGANGVRQWCEQIYNNLSPEIKARVKQDVIKGF